MHEFEGSQGADAVIATFYPPYGYVVAVICGVAQTLLSFVEVPNETIGISWSDAMASPYSIREPDPNDPEIANYRFYLRWGRGVKTTRWEFSEYSAESGYVGQTLFDFQQFTEARMGAGRFFHAGDSVLQ
ncbi:MAG: hypothetical protein MUC92_01735 [Fimbriimonadaceae bacterium]|jgi:hypothetical protein|nr:hypothetical protein [Fimbriimonadaceae bacterium]